jgi:two-component system cell cycle response regulator
MPVEEKIKILIVDDSATQMEFLSEWLIKDGYEVFTASNGTEGLTQAFEILPDLIIADIVMPGMNGYLMCRLLKNEEISSHIPVILLSNLEEEKQRFWGLKCGANAFVTKGEEKKAIPPLIKELCCSLTAVAKEKRKAPTEEKVEPDFHISNMLDRLMMESTVYMESINLFNLVYDPKQLIDRFFDLLSRMVKYSHAGLLIMIPEKPTLYIHSQEKLNAAIFDKIKTMVIAENELTGEEGELELITLKEASGKFSEVTEDINSSLSFPLKKGLGTISIFSSTPKYYDENSGSVVHILADSFSMVVELMLSYQETKLQTITDIMTGLYNWSYFELSLDREINAFKRYKTNFCVVMISIDFYKTLVDTFGRRRGEMVLRQVADVLKKNFRATDLIAQYGQSEFVGLFVQTDMEGAHIGAERLKKYIEEHFNQSAQRPFRLTISIGVAEYTEETTSKDELIDNAVDGLKSARNKGGNRVEDFVPPPKTPSKPPPKTPPKTPTKR